MFKLLTSLTFFLTLTACGTGLIEDDENEENDSGVIDTLDLTLPQPSAAGCEEGLKLMQGFNLSGDVIHERRCTYNKKDQLTEGAYYTLSDDESTTELELSSRTSLTYDDMGRVKKKKTYFSSFPDPEDEYLTWETNYTYDKATGYLKTSVREDYVEANQTTPYHTTTFTYDKLGRLIKTVDKDNNEDEESIDTTSCVYVGDSFYDSTCTTIVDGKTTKIETTSKASSKTKNLVDGKLLTTDTITYFGNQPSYVKKRTQKTYTSDGDLHETETQVCTQEDGSYDCTYKAVNSDNKTCFTESIKSKYVGKVRIKSGAMSFDLDAYAGSIESYDNSDIGGEQSNGASGYTLAKETTVRYFHHADIEAPCNSSIEISFNGPGEPEDEQADDFDITFKFSNSYDGKRRLTKRTLQEKTQELEELYDRDDEFNQEWTYR